MSSFDNIPTSPQWTEHMDIADLTRRVIAHADLHQATGDPLAFDIAGLSLVRQRSPTVFTPVLYQPLLCLVLQGAKQSSLGTRNVTFGAMQSLIVSIDLPTQSRVVQASAAAPYVALALELNLGLLRELAALTGLSMDDEGDAISAGPADQDMVDAFGRLFGLVGNPQAAQVLAPLIIREIHYRLLGLPHGGMLRHLLQQDGHASRIARSIATIRRDVTAPLRVVDLARVAGMSVSGFHDHFKAVTATTPLQFQKQLRLIAARQMMLAGHHSVTSTAFEVGYESPTQFSRDYTRAFGTSPSRERRAEV
jgi:AraC-like DNA-binding protein